MVPQGFEQARGHGSPGADHGGVKHPAAGPAGLQPVARQKEVGRRGEPVMCRVARGVAFQAGSGLAGEQGARHGDFLFRERFDLGRDVRQGLAGERLEKAHEFAHFER